MKFEPTSLKSRNFYKCRRNIETEYPEEERYQMTSDSSAQQFSKTTGIDQRGKKREQ